MIKSVLGSRVTRRSVSAIPLLLFYPRRHETRIETDGAAQPSAGAGSGSVEVNGSDSDPVTAMCNVVCGGRAGVRRIQGSLAGAQAEDACGRPVASASASASAAAFSAAAFSPCLTIA